MFIFAKFNMNVFLPHGRDTFKNTPITLSWVGVTICITLAVNVGRHFNWIYTVWNQPAHIALERWKFVGSSAAEVATLALLDSELGAIGTWSNLEQYQTKVNGIQFPVDLESTQNPYQIWWWPLIAVFYYPLRFSTIFHFVTNMYILYSYSVQLERHIFKNM